MVTVKVAKTRREIRDFVIFPTKLYENDPYYVPDMVGDQINDLMPDKNPAFEYCEARCFLAYRDGKIVGRVAGILNKRANEKNHVNYLRFAFFDFIDDAEVTDALYNALADYARELGCVAIHGPQGFSDMDREGMLVEGFDRLSQFFVYYNYPYYLDHMARLGFVKEVDWIEFLIHVPDAVPPRMEKIVSYTKKHMALEIKDLSDKKNLPKYLKDVFALYNEAYQVIFGMVPLTPKQIEKYTHEFLPLVTNDTSCFVAGGLRRGRAVPVQGEPEDPGPAVPLRVDHHPPGPQGQERSDRHAPHRRAAGSEGRGLEPGHPGGPAAQGHQERRQVRGDRAPAGDEQGRAVHVAALRHGAAQAPPLLHSHAGRQRAAGGHPAGRSQRAQGPGAGAGG